MNEHDEAIGSTRSNCVGIVPPKIHRDMMLSMFFQRVLNGIVNAAEELRQDLVLFTGRERNNPESVAQDLLEARIDAVILLAPHAETPLLELLSEREFPFAVVASGRAITGLGFEIDNACGTTLALEHLWSLGHRRIAHVAGVEHSGDGRVRFDAYSRFLHSKGLTVPRHYVANSDFLFSGGFEAAKRLLDQVPPPTAIFAANDDSALGVMEYAREIGLRIPEDLSVVGFDDTDAGSRAVPPLTTVRQPMEEMGELAMRAVVARAEGRDVFGFEFPTTLIVRGSTAAPPADGLRA